MVRPANVSEQEESKHIPQVHVHTLGHITKVAATHINTVQSYIQTILMGKVKHSTTKRKYNEKG